MLCGGENADAALAKDSPLARFVPGATMAYGISTANRSGALEMMAGGHNTIPKSGERVDLPAARLTDVQGHVEPEDGDVPLVVRGVRGLGQVIFVAVDLDGPSMRAWSDRPALLAAILKIPATEPPAEVAGAAESYGYDDLAGQLRLAGAVPRRAAGSVFLRRLARGGLHPADRAGRLFFPPADAARHGLDLDHLPGGGRALRRGLPLGLDAAEGAT